MDTERAKQILEDELDKMKVHRRDLLAQARTLQQQLNEVAVQIKAREDTLHPPESKPEEEEESPELVREE